MPASTRFASAAGLIAGLTLGSRILGLIRECVFGYFFATSELLSAFRIAFMAPNLARRLFGEGALSSALIPVLTGVLSKEGEEEGRRFVGAVITAVAGLLVGLVFAIEVIIAGWRAIHDDIALRLTAILIPYLALICLVAVGGAVLHVRLRFAAPALAPVILNLGIISSAVGGAVWAAWSDLRLMHAICGGVLVAGVLQVVVIAIALKRADFFPRLTPAWRHPQVGVVARLMGPMVLGLSAVQINTLADYLIAYLFVRADGERIGPAVLGYAQYLYQLPLGVFGIAIATAIFPALSRAAAEDDRPGLTALVRRGMRLSLFIALPAAVGLIFVARPLVATLYERGAWDAAATQRVAGVLLFYSLGIPAYFVQHILVRTFYSMQDSRTPARVAGWMVLLNLGLNLILVQWLEEGGLALATAVYATGQVLWLRRALATRLPAQPVRQGDRIRTFISLSAMIASLFALMLVDWRSRFGQLAQPAALVAMVVAGVAVYLGFARLLRVRAWEELRSLTGSAQTRGDDRVRASSTGPGR